MIDTSNPALVAIRAPVSWDGDEGLLAVIVRASFVPQGVAFVTAPELPQQVAVMAHSAGHVVEAHTHHRVARIVDRTQEVILVRRGRVELTIYTSAGIRVERCDLDAGDLVVLIAGGHGLTVLEDCELVEVKQGPYLGRDQDKTALPATGERSS